MNSFHTQSACVCLCRCVSLSLCICTCMHAWCVYVCVCVGRAAAGLWSNIHFNMSSRFQGICALGKWLTLNKWSLTLEEAVSNMRSRVNRSDQSHVFVLRRETYHHLCGWTELLESMTDQVLHAAVCLPRQKQVKLVFHTGCICYMYMIFSHTRDDTWYVMA